MSADNDNWHAKPWEDVMRELGARHEGLTDLEVAERLETYGPNVLAEEVKANPFMRFLDQFRSPLIYILLVASAIAFLLREYIDGAVILFIVIFNAVIGFVQEYKAEKALEALKQLAAPTANVLRSGDLVSVPSEEVAPGDIIRVAAGDRVPADARLIEAVRIKVEEAALTGESTPADKQEEPLPADIAVADRNNMVFAGTTVAAGRGTAVVTSTGLNTITGRIARDVQAAPSVETPISRKLGQIGNLLGVVGSLVAALLIGIGILRGFTIYELFLTAVAVAVSFIPEGLPAIVTIVLAIGVQRMARRRAIIRKLPAVETLGSTTVICTDKTGTLTQNEMTVRIIATPKTQYTLTGEGYRPEGSFITDESPTDPREHPELMRLLDAVTLANDSHLVEEDDQWWITGDPTEGALVVAARKAGLRKPALEEAQPRIDEIPFDSDAKYMATLHRADTDRTLVYVKGAPEVVLAMCDRVLDGEQPVELDDDRRRALQETNHHLAEQAYRVLAAAYREMPGDEEDLEHRDVESGMTFLGLLGMIDPPRPEVLDAVGKARQAGIRVIMITGDNPDTARAIARELGITAPCPPKDGLESPNSIPAAHADECLETITGRELQRMSEEELERRIPNIAVFARVDPQHKLRIVQALKKQGAIVAMTGDGVNDAPALKTADIGVAMGITGTDVSRESSDMVLSDDNFATIIAAVEEGRTIFANLRKVVQYLLATNTGEVLTFIVAIVAGFPIPLLPVQILWVNLVTDGFATAPISVEPKEGEVLRQPPRDPREPIVTKRSLWRIAMVAAIMTAGTVGLFYYELQVTSLATARTMAFATLAIFQLFNAFNARSSTQSIFRLGFLSNPYVLAGVGVSFLLQIVVVEVPWFETIFRTTGLTLAQWGLVILVSSSVLIVEEIRKALAPRLFEG